MPVPSAAAASCSSESHSTRAPTGGDGGTTSTVALQQTADKKNNREQQAKRGNSIEEEPKPEPKSSKDGEASNNININSSSSSTRLDFNCLREGPAAEIRRVQLTPDQKAALALAVTHRKNLFIGGAAGVGKSGVLRAIACELAHTHKLKVAVTATTGVASLTLGGYTFHRVFGLKCHASANRFNPTALRAYDVLILDEVSMINARMLEDFDAQCRAARGWSKKTLQRMLIENSVNGDDGSRIVASCPSTLPFGGLQVILSGDFAQLNSFATQSSTHQNAPNSSRHSAASSWATRAFIRENGHVVPPRIRELAKLVEKEVLAANSDISRMVFESSLFKKKSSSNNSSDDHASSSSLSDTSENNINKTKKLSNKNKCEKSSADGGGSSPSAASAESSSFPCDAAASSTLPAILSCQLVTKMRQAADPVFAQALDKLRNGQIDARLRRMCINKKSKLPNPETSLYLFPTRLAAKEHNEAMLLTACDVVKHNSGNHNNNNTSSASSSSSSSSKTRKQEEELRSQPTEVTYSPSVSLTGSENSDWSAPLRVAARLDVGAATTSSESPLQKKDALLATLSVYPQHGSGCGNTLHHHHSTTVVTASGLRLPASYARMLQQQGKKVRVNAATGTVTKGDAALVRDRLRDLVIGKMKQYLPAGLQNEPIPLFVGERAKVENGHVKVIRTNNNNNGSSSCGSDNSFADDFVTPPIGEVSAALDLELRVKNTSSNAAMTKLHETSLRRAVEELRASGLLAAADLPPAPSAFAAPASSSSSFDGDDTTTAINNMKRRSNRSRRNRDSGTAAAANAASATAVVSRQQPGIGVLNGHNHAGWDSLLASSPSATTQSSKQSLLADRCVDRDILQPRQLKRGCRVMLLRNISPTLVNGCCGTLLGFYAPSGPDDERFSPRLFRKPQMRDKSTTLLLPLVKFDGGETCLVPLINDIAPGGSASQFRNSSILWMPLAVAYASTVHKIQGCTVDGPVVLDMSRAWPECQSIVYVAASRCKTMKQLRIINFDEKRHVHCNAAALRFAASLPSSVDMLKRAMAEEQRLRRRRPSLL